MCVDGGDDVEEAGDYDEARAPIGYGELNGICAKAHGATDDVEEAAAEIAEQAEDFEDVVGVGVELALHRKPDGKHADDGDGEQSAATPFAKQKVSRAGDEPAGDQGKEYKAVLSALLRNGFLVLSVCHSFLTISQWTGGRGSLRVSAQRELLSSDWQCQVP